MNKEGVKDNEDYQNKNKTEKDNKERKKTKNDTEKDIAGNRKANIWPENEKHTCIY